MAPPIRLNAFAMNCVGHQSPGLWRHPRDRSAEYGSLAYWTELARTLERGLFDGLFLADVLGVYDVYAGSPAAALRNAAQVPLADPMLLVPAMAAVTERLGFGITCNLSYEPPYLLARRFSTLDQLTGGRVGWNIVTGYLDSAARAMGLPRQAAHDDRYDVAEEYMQVVYALWEGSWADDAVVADRARGVFVDPERVRAVRHEGPHFRLDGIHLCAPTPQRTPFLYQAGTSPKGRDFAGRHAEAVFLSGPSEAVVAPRVAALRQSLAAHGRDPGDVTVYALATVIVAGTDAAAEARLAEYRAHISDEGALTLMSGWTGVDFSRLDLDAEVRHVENDAGRSAMDNITRADPGRVWTVREVARHVGIGGIGPVFVGAPATVADALEGWIARTGVDGFNLAYAVAPESFTDAVDLLVPELQGRGRYPLASPAGTLRARLTGRSRLPASHPAASLRRG
ncbi:Dimethyl-sulfide monooxygenase [Methylobacterium crusticola]|uniref:Dimethyl-sulfide monooxygenase n=1 Tax=Methylobacterium crusticola TaxID=1697972 RepID=A0ABQ4QWZ0_9HYPH|nr:LLM class flavin-dependent oxidoreductase [Methylobacterium crusticola]GJD49883.1 Dimethyl-sulfide monooxygenase [Methylobacterium crusticola]